MLKVLHVGLGPLGQRIIADLYARRLGTVVAAVDLSPQIAGRPLRELVPSATDNPTIHADLAKAIAKGPFDVALVTTSSDLGKCADTFKLLLAAGISIVSTCEELTFPWLRHANLATELDQLAKRSKARLLGTGVNPGAMMDTIPVFVTAVCTKVSAIEVHRIQDASPRRLPFQKKIGATLSPQDFQKGVSDGWLRHVGLGESLHFVAHYLGLPFDRWEETIEPVIATTELSCGLGTIKPGHAAGVRQVAKGLRANSPDPVITMIFQAAINQANPHDRVVVSSEPPLDVTFKNGVHGDIATSAMTLNAIASLLAANPGLHTSATVPLLRYTRNG